RRAGLHRLPAPLPSGLPRPRRPPALAPADVRPVLMPKKYRENRSWLRKRREVKKESRRSPFDVAQSSKKLTTGLVYFNLKESGCQGKNVFDSNHFATCRMSRGLPSVNCRIR